MTSDVTRQQTTRLGTFSDAGERQRPKRAGRWRHRMPALELLETRCLLSGGNGPQGVAAGAGPDPNVWFTLSSNAIGMVNPAKPAAGMTQYQIPTLDSGPGPIAAGPQAILYASDNINAQLYKIDKATGTVLQTIPVAKAQDSLIFDSQNELIYTTNVGGAAEVRRVDPTVGISSDTLIATIGSIALDLTLMPGGHSVLAVDVTSGKLYEVSLDHPGQTTTVSSTAKFEGGIVYDSTGRLFAVANSSIVELDPNTFSVIASSGSLSSLDGLAYDSFTGDLFASSFAINAASGRAGIYELSLQPGSFLQATLITSSSFSSSFRPDGLETDGEGTLYIASLHDRVDQYDITTGKMTPLTGALSGLDDLVPLSGTGGHSVPDYWFYEQNAGQFGAIDPTTGSITEIPFTTTGNPQINGITAGPGGTIWFTEFNTDRIGMLDTDTHLITEFTPPTANAEPYGIVEGPDGTIWFTEAGANQIGKINPITYKIQEFRIDSSGDDEAEGVTFGPDGNLWFVLTGLDAIGEMNPRTGVMIGEYGVPTPNAGLAQIVSDPADGSLWFTEDAAGQVGMINATTKVITEFAMPTASATPQALVVARNGNIWLAESNSGRFAEIAPTSPVNITEYAIPGFATQWAIAPGGEPPSSIVAGGSFGLRLIAEDGAGTQATGFNGSVTLTLVNGSGVTLQGPATANAQGGLVTFTGLSINTVGTYQIQATSGGLSPVVTLDITVTPGAATQLVVVPGSLSSPVVAGAGFGLTVDAEDGYGNLDRSFAGTVQLGLANAPGVILHGTATATANAGTAKFSGLWITTAGTYAFLATYLNLAPLTSSSIVISAGNAVALAIAQQPPTNATAGQVFSTAPVVEEVDQYGNPVTGDSTSVVTAARGDLGTSTLLGGALSLTLVNGEATFGGLSYNKAEAMDITFTSSAAGISPVTSGPVQVAGAAPSQLVISQQPSTTATAGQPFGAQPAVLVEDQFGNLVTDDNTTRVTAFVASGAGTLSGPTIVTASQGVAQFAGLHDDVAGTVKLAFMSGILLVPTSKPIVISPADPYMLAVRTQPSAVATVGQPFASQPMIVEEDRYGNVETGDSTTVVTVSPSGGSGSLAGEKSVALNAGVASFTGLADSNAETIALVFSGGNLPAVQSTPITITSTTPTPTPTTPTPTPTTPTPTPTTSPTTTPTSTPAPTIVVERVVMTPKSGKKGKSHLAGFALQFSTAMNAQSAESAGNYTVTAATSKRIKGKKGLVYSRVAVRAAYDAATQTVTLTLAGKSRFAAGGEITVDSSPPNGVVSAAGVALDPSDATFAIGRGAKGITAG